MDLNKDSINICPLYPFIGWRIWKMKNNLIFSGKRNSIPNTIGRAVMDCQQWIDALHQLRDPQEQTNSQRKNENMPKTMADVVVRTNTWYCFIDGSWISEKHKAGIGWLLVNHRGTRVMKGSTSIAPVVSSLEAEAYAFREVVQQVKRHGYRNVAFYGDLKVMFDTLEKSLKEAQKGRNQAIVTYCEDIKRLAIEEFGFKFGAVPREVHMKLMP